MESTVAAIAVATEATASTTSSTDVNYKSRLEWKMCIVSTVSLSVVQCHSHLARLQAAASPQKIASSYWKIVYSQARDTPEPEFDLTDCRLKEVPSGVFVLCRVLLKERLRLNNNCLRTLSGGGALSDLSQLRSIDLSSNRFTKLPDDLHALQNLRVNKKFTRLRARLITLIEPFHRTQELILSNNQVAALPAALNQLRNLELLNVSFNALTQIDQIVYMPNLRVLILNGNKQLRRLPTGLTTCDSLTDISLDVDSVEYPPPAVTSRGTLDILQFLQTGIVVEMADDTPATRIKSATHDFIAIEKGEIAVEPAAGHGRHGYGPASDQNQKEHRFIEHERNEYERFQNMDALLHQQSQQRKQELLRNLLHQQNETDTRLKQLQQDRDVERSKLIESILLAEENAGLIVDQLITLKNGPDAALLEQERIEQERLLEQVRFDHAELRKRDILTAMSETLETESRHIQMYHEQRDAANRMRLEQETSATNYEDMIRSMDRERQNVMAVIADDENWQKVAVAKFIEQNDARTWGLVEQVRLVESQLAAMTQCEIERKKCEMSDRLVSGVPAMASTQSKPRLILTFFLHL